MKNYIPLLLTLSLGCAQNQNGSKLPTENQKEACDDNGTLPQDQFSSDLVQDKETIEIDEHQNLPIYNFQNLTLELKSLPTTDQEDKPSPSPQSIVDCDSFYRPQLESPNPVPKSPSQLCFFDRFLGEDKASNDQPEP